MAETKVLLSFKDRVFSDFRLAVFHASDEINFRDSQAPDLTGQIFRPISYPLVDSNPSRSLGVPTTLPSWCRATVAIVRSRIAVGLPARRFAAKSPT